MLHTLNRVPSAEQLPLQLIVGASWEGYVIEQVSQLKPEHIDLYYYRTHNGAECDLLLVSGLRPVMAIEIKFSSNPSLSKVYRSSKAKNYDHKKLPGWRDRDSGRLFLFLHLLVIYSPLDVDEDTET